MNYSRSKTITFLGIMLALSIGIMFLGSIFSVSYLSSNGSVSAILISLVLCEHDLKKAFIFYIVNIILIAVFIPKKFTLFFYVIFGGYIFYKFFVEKHIKRKVLQIPIKSIYFIMITIIEATLLNQIIVPWIGNNTSFLVFIGIIEIIFGLLYDFVNTLCMKWYTYTFKREKKEFKLSGD